MNVFETPPGATPILDASALLRKDLFTYTALCEAEAENILEAIGKHFRRKRSAALRWLDVQFLLRLHREMFHRVWGWAGKFRRTETNIGVAPFDIPIELKKLLDDVHFWGTVDSDMSPVEQTVRFHHRLVWIHPFENGNGRHARLAADLLLKALGGQLPKWPGNLSVSTPTRKEYLLALRSADRGSYDDLEGLIRSLGASD